MKNIITVLSLVLIVFISACWSDANQDSSIENENPIDKNIGTSTGSGNPKYKLTYNFNDAKFLLSPTGDTDFVILQKRTLSGNFDNAIFIAENDRDGNLGLPRIKFVKQFREDIFYVVYEEKFSDQGNEPCLFYQVIENRIASCVDHEVYEIDNEYQIGFDREGNIFYQAFFSENCNRNSIYSNDNINNEGNCDFERFVRYKSNERFINVTYPEQSISNFVVTQDGYFYMQGSDFSSFFRRWEVDDQGQVKVYDVWPSNSAHIYSLFLTNDNRIVFSGYMTSDYRDEVVNPLNELNQQGIIQPFQPNVDYDQGFFEIDVEDNQFVVRSILSNENSHDLDRDCIRIISMDDRFDSYLGEREGIFENDRGLFYYFYDQYRFDDDNIDDDWNFINNRRSSFKVVHINGENSTCTELAQGEMNDLRSYGDAFYYFEKHPQGRKLFQLSIYDEINRTLLFDEAETNIRLFDSYYVQNNESVYLTGITFPDNEKHFIEIDLQNNNEITIDDEVFERDIDIFVPIIR